MMIHTYNFHHSDGTITVKPFTDHHYMESINCSGVECENHPEPIRLDLAKKLIDKWNASSKNCPYYYSL